MLSILLRDNKSTLNTDKTTENVGYAMRYRNISFVGFSNIKT